MRNFVKRFFIVSWLAALAIIYFKRERIELVECAFWIGAVLVPQFILLGLVNPLKLFDEDE